MRLLLRTIFWDQGHIIEVNPIRPRVGHIVPHLSRICVYLGKYTYKRIEKNLTFLSYELWVNEARLIFRSAKRHTYMDISCKRLKLHHLVTELKYEHIFEYFTIQKFSSQWSTWPKTHTQKVKVLFLNQKDFMMAKITFLRLFC